MFCNTCGTENVENAEYCIKCGTAVSVSPGVKTASEEVKAETSATPPLDAALLTEQLKATVGQGLTQGAQTFTTVVSSPTVKQNVGSFTAGAGGVVALFAFAFLPYFNIPFGQGTSLPLVGSELASMHSLSTFIPGAADVSFIWLEPLIAIAVICMAAYAILKKRALKLTPSIEKGIAIATIGISGVTLLILVIKMVSDQTPILNSAVQGTANAPSISLASMYGIGVWMYFIGILAVLVGGILQYNKK